MDPDLSIYILLKKKPKPRHFGFWFVLGFNMGTLCTSTENNFHLPGWMDLHAGVENLRFYQFMVRRKAEGTRFMEHLLGSWDVSHGRYSSTSMENRENRALN